MNSSSFQALWLLSSTSCLDRTGNWNNRFPREVVRLLQKLFRLHGKTRFSKLACTLVDLDTWHANHHSRFFATCIGPTTQFILWLAAHESNLLKTKLPTINGALCPEWDRPLQVVCMFDKFHVTCNPKSKVSRDVFKNKIECQLTSIFYSKMSPQYLAYTIF
jgi:hypothetical protein